MTHSGNKGELALLCKSITQVTTSMKQFEFSILKKVGVDLEPGLHLKIKYPDMKGILKERLYSISKYCDHSGTLSIAVKKENYYGVSAAIFHGLKPGTVIHSEGISGERFGDISQKHLSFFCSGSGITPVMSLLRSLDKYPESKRPKLINLFYSVKNIGNAYFLSELLEFDLNYSWLRLHLFVTSPTIINDHQFINKGRIDVIAIQRLLSEKIDKAYFFGGTGFVEELKKIFYGLRNSTFGSKENRSNQLQSSKLNKIKITKNNSDNKTIYFYQDSDETVLELLERDGVNINSMCRSGICGTCKVKLRSGDVGSVDECGLTEFEKTEGYVLACCSRPQGDIEILV